MMLQCSGRTRIPCLGGGGANVPSTTGIHTRSKLPLLSSASASAPASSPSLSAHSHHVPVSSNPIVINSVVPFQAITAASCAVHRPTEADLGCLVCVDDDRVGILRFIGAVQFACGVWCGLELTNDKAMGKNDGQVHGVRYFKCSKQRGLMVPLSKVTTMQQEDNEESMISSSGPHSLLITNISDESTMVNSSVQDTTKTICQNGNDTFKKWNEPHYENQTFTADNPDKILNINDASFCIKDANIETLSNNQINLSKMDSLDEVSDKLQTPQCSFIPFIFTKNQHQSTPVNLRTAILNPNTHQQSNSGSSTLLCTSSSIDDPNNKRNSLEFEESLGILTPDQMPAITGSGLIVIRPSSFFYRSPSTENMVSVWIPPGEGGSAAGGEGGSATDGALIGMIQDNTRSCAELSTSDLSPSLGIIDENGLAAAFNLKSLTVSGEHLTLSLDVQQLLDANRCSAGSGSSLVNACFRADQTPSPEELPLDPTPVMLSTVVGDDDNDREEGDVLRTVGDGGKGVSGEKKNAVGSFIASIISITSLDTGYQGDGEMSRPGSRGADNASSPMTRRPQPRRNMCDPMTDSDFYTESDADCHESDPQNQQSLHHPHNHRSSGDRRAQVIDGTLYAADAHSSASNGNGSSAAGAAVYPDSGREPMDSSGVFTDIEGVADAFSLYLNRTIVAASPSDSSTQTITDDSQQQVILKNRGVTSGTTCVVKSNSVKTLVNSGGDRSGSERSSASPKAGRLISSAKKDDNVNKYSKAGSAISKKRIVDSKVFKDATNINTRNINSTAPASPPASNTSAQKKQGKWDAVLNKIGKGSRLAEARSLKDVKARVYSSVAPSAQHATKPSSSRGDKTVAVEKIGTGRCIGSTMKNGSAIVAAKSETRDREGGAGKAAGMKPRRILRTRTPSAAAAAKHSNVESSISSSLSDLSGASPAKKPGSLKPQRLGFAKLSPKSLGGGNATTISSPHVLQQSSPKTPTTANNNNINQHPHQQLQGINNNVVNNNNSKNASTTPSPVTSRGKQHHQLLKSAAAAEKDRKTTATAGIAVVSDATVKDSLTTRQHNKHHSSCNNHNHNIHHDNNSSLSPNAASAQLLNGNNNAIATLTNGQTTPTIHCSSPPQTRRTQARNLTSTTIAKTTILPQQSRNTQAAESFRDTARAAEALAVLVQHLVYEVDAFQAPILKQQVTIMRCTCTQLRETIREQTVQFTEALDYERTKSKAELIQLKKSDTDKLEKVANERDDLDHVVQTLKSQMQKLQKIHEEQLEILREENDAIRDQLDERNLEIVSLQKQQQQHYIVVDRVDKTTYTKSVSENGLITVNYEGDPNSQEVQSLRAVLDLKQAEYSELRKALAEAVQKCERLPSVEEKLSTRTARCEDLDLQLKRQREIEQQLQAEINKLKNSIKDESNQKHRLSQYNEELQWKLKQSKEVISKVIEQATAEEQQQHLSRSTALNSSFSEKNYHNTYACSTSCVGSLSSSPRHPTSLDRSNSFRLRSNSNLSEQSVISNTCSSSPTSPKVKGVVTKSDSVSYMLDMEESSDVLASRIVRRSFRTNSSSNAASQLKVGGDNSTHGLSTLSTTPSPKQRSPTNGSSTSVGRRASSSVGNGSSETKKYLRSKSMTVQRTSESACSDSATNNTAVTEDEEDDDDDDIGVFWQFNAAANSAEGQKKRLLPTNQSSTPCSRYEQPLLRSTSLEPKLETYRHQETDDSDEEQIQLPALPRQGTVLPPPRHLATDACNSEDDDNSCSSSTSSADRL